jgi:hypothetical protein
VICNYEKVSWFLHCKQLAVHFGSVDVHVRRVMVKEEERDQVEIVYVRRYWIGEGPKVSHDVLHRWSLQPSFENGFRFVREIGRVLPLNDAAQSDGARN